LEGGSPSVAGAKCTGIANGEAFAWPVQRINPPVFIERSARAAPYFIADLSLAVQKKKPPPVVFNAPVGKRNQDCHSYWFYIPGLDFKLAVGKGISPSLTNMSAFALPERFIYSSTLQAEEMMKSFATGVGKSAAVGKLAREFPDA